MRLALSFQPSEGAAIDDGLSFQKPVDLLAGPEQVFDLLLFALADRGVVLALFVFIPMLGQHVTHGVVDLFALLFQRHVGAALLFGGVGGQLAAVDGQHLLADQAHVIADQQHLVEKLGDVLVGGGDELGDGGEVGAGDGGQGHEQDVLDAAAAGDASGLGQQHDFKKKRRVVGAAARVLVAVFVVENTQVEFLLDQVVEGVFEGAGQDLAFEAD